MQRCQSEITRLPLLNRLKRKRNKIDVGYTGFFESLYCLGGPVFRRPSHQGKAGSVDNKVGREFPGAFLAEKAVKSRSEIKSSAVSDAGIEVPGFQCPKQVLQVLHVFAQHRCTHGKNGYLASALPAPVPVEPFFELYCSVEGLGRVGMIQCGIGIKYRVFLWEPPGERGNVAVNQEAEKALHVFIGAVKPKLMGSNECMDIPCLARNMLHDLADITYKRKLALAFAGAVFWLES